jgi:hypothetical protein
MAGMIGPAPARRVSLRAVARFRPDNPSIGGRRADHRHKCESFALESNACGPAAARESA